VLRESTELFGATLVRSGLATRRQVALALSIQQQRHDAGQPHMRIGDIMVERGFVTSEELSDLVAGRAPRGTKKFGDLCVRMGFLDDAQVERALAEQKRLRACGTFRRLGEILIEMKQMKAAQLPAVLGAQGFEIAECTKCRVTYNVEPGAAGRGPVTCATCGRELIFVTAYDDDALLELEESREAVQADAAAAGDDPRRAAAPAKAERRATADVPSIPGAVRPTSSTAPLIIMPSPEVMDLDKKLTRAREARREAEKRVRETAERLVEVEAQRASAEEEAFALKLRLAEADELGEELARRERDLEELRGGLQEAERARDDALNELGDGQAEIGDARKELLLARLEMENKEAEITRVRSETRRFTNEARRLATRVEELERTVEHLKCVVELKDAYIKQLEEQCNIQRDGTATE